MAKAVALPNQGLKMFIESVKTNNGEYIELYTADGQVILMLEYVVDNDEIEVKGRHLDKYQVDALIKALRKAKKELC